MADLLVTRLVPAPLTPEQIAAGASARKDSRNKILEIFTELQKNGIPVLTKLVTPSDIAKYITTFFTKEIAWWNANVELSFQQVTTRKTAFDETWQTNKNSINQLVLIGISSLSNEDAQAYIKSYPFKDFKATLQNKLDSKMKADAEADADKNQAILNSGWYDSVKEALGPVFIALIVIGYILIGLRFASFAANDYLHKPLPYRIHVFIYTFIFAPFLLPYYIWREIKTYFSKADLPHVYSFFPVNEFDPDLPVPEKTKLYNRLFGLPTTIKNWLAQKEEADKKGRVDALVSTILEDVKKEISER